MHGRGRGAAGGREAELPQRARQHGSIQQRLHPPLPRAQGQVQVLGIRGAAQPGQLATGRSLVGVLNVETTLFLRLLCIHDSVDVRWSWRATAGTAP